MQTLMLKLHTKTVYCLEDVRRFSRVYAEQFVKGNRPRDRDGGITETYAELITEIIHPLWKNSISKYVVSEAIRQAFKIFHERILERSAEIK